jgi:hypothetical protein
MNIIIHGEMNYGFALSKDLQERCDKALEFLEEDVSTIFGLSLKRKNISWKTCIYCTGGIFHPKQQGIPVSLAMKRYLQFMNCPVEVFTEEKSITSIHNVERMMDIDEATIISSRYHLPRLKFIWSMTNTKTKFIGSKCSLSLKRIGLELLGIYSALLYGFGFTGRELRFRNNTSRTL